jgi:hypothetical protein
VPTGGSIQCALSYLSVGTSLDCNATFALGAVSPVFVLTGRDVRLNASRGSVAVTSPSYTQRVAFVYTAALTSELVNLTATNAFGALVAWLPLTVVARPFASLLTCAPAVIGLAGVALCTVVPLDISSQRVLAVATDFRPALAAGSVSGALSPLQPGFGAPLTMAFSAGGQAGPAVVEDGLSRAQVVVVGEARCLPPSTCAHTNTQRCSYLTDAVRAQTRRPPAASRATRPCSAWDARRSARWCR